MARIEIDIREDIDPVIAMDCVRRVIAEGKVSHGEKGKMYYCWAMSFLTQDGMIWVSTRQYRKADCFVVYKDKRKE